MKYMFYFMDKFYGTLFIFSVSLDFSYNMQIRAHANYINLVPCDINYFS